LENVLNKRSSGKWSTLPTQ